MFIEEQILPLKMVHIWCS